VYYQYAELLCSVINYLIIFKVYSQKRVGVMGREKQRERKNFMTQKLIIVKKGAN
jgi:hypothetical protein